jgi:nucleotide sugar dehydrogenase
MSICVHGLGYIGLATASLFANNGHDVVGYDVDENGRERLERGEPDVSEASLESYTRQALEGSLTVSAEPVPAEYHIVCVPTPRDRDSGGADLSYVVEATETISSLLRPDDVVVLESTVPPGTTETVVAPKLAQSGLEPGRDIGLGYVPETMLPGNAVVELETNDRIVGGFDRASAATVEPLYDDVPTGTLRTAPDATTAEFVKLVQNAYRDVNIAFANSLALLAADHDVPVREAIEMANTHPRVDILNPGPGVGGHCLPIDPHFLGDGSDETELIDTARAVNDSMPDHVVDLLRDALGELEGKTIAVLGIAYKGNVSDTRNSPGLAIGQRLGAEVAHPVSLADGGRPDIKVRFADPKVTDADVELHSVVDALAGADAAVLAAAHDEFASLDPRVVGNLLQRRVVVDPLDLLDGESWGDRGFELVGL